MTDPERERSLDETQPIQTPLPAEPAVPADAPVTPTPPPVEAAAASPAATPPTPWYADAPVQPVKAARRGGGGRWAIAAVLIVAVVGVAAGAALLLTGRAAEPDAYAYIPAGAAMVMEVRPDLPGDQREKLTQLISKFPGFADQSTFETKLDEAIDRFADEAAGRDVDYATEVKPFLGHPLVIGVTKIPEDPENSTSSDGFIAIATSSGTPSCDGAGFGTAVETVAHAGRQISVYEDGGQRFACVVDGNNILGGGIDDVKLALDTKAGATSLATDPSLEAARAQLTGDTLGLFYMSGSALDRFIELAQQEQAEQGMPAVDMPDMPDWLVMGIRAESDGLLFDAVMPMPEAAEGASPLPTIQPSRVSALAPKLPATTIFALEGHDFGTGVDTLLTQLAANPGMEDTVKQLDTALAFMGGRQAILGWMGDVSIVVTKDGTTFGGGLVFATPDETKANATMNQLKGLFTLAGGQGIGVAEEPHGSATITTITFDLETLGGALGLGGTPDLPASFDLSYTVQGGLVIFGVGSEFVKEVLDTAPGQSLADQPRYQAAMALVGATNGGQAYLDLTSGIEALEELALPMAGPDALAEYQRDVAPYVEPLDAVAWSVSGDGGFARIKFGMTVHEAQQ